MGMAKKAWLSGILVLGALLALGAVAWACTPGQMLGQLWLTGPTGVNVLDDATGGLGDCPTPIPAPPGETSFRTGDVVCVQAKNVKRNGTGSIPDPTNPTGPEIRLYEVKYVPVDDPDDPSEHMVCHNSRLTLPNLSKPHGLYEARQFAHGSGLVQPGGWENQQTVLPMPGGSYVVCAASVTEPAVDGTVVSGGVGWFDAGPDGDPNTGHLSIFVS